MLSLPITPVWIPLLFPLPVLAFFCYWLLFKAYPIYLEQQVRKGKGWIYLPLTWKGKQRSKISILTFVLRGLSAVIIALSILWTTAWDGIPWVILASAIGLFIEEFLRIRLEKIRFNQQEVIYFELLGNIIQQYDNQGKRASELEIRNLCSWEHQHRLRTADEKGQLLIELKKKVQPVEAE